MFDAVWSEDGAWTPAEVARVLRPRGLFAFVDDIHARGPDLPAPRVLHELLRRLEHAGLELIWVEELSALRRPHLSPRAPAGHAVPRHTYLRARAVLCKSMVDDRRVRLVERFFSELLAA
ncbi:MAG: hypothetical protein FJ029_00520 [Actinobacteria bacterium]|nr:hypothetical protein [Actinomycetota bacterium]